MVDALWTSFAGSWVRVSMMAGGARGGRWRVAARAGVFMHCSGSWCRQGATLIAAGCMRRVCVRKGKERDAREIATIPAVDPFGRPMLITSPAGTAEDSVRTLACLAGRPPCHLHARTLAGSSCGDELSSMGPSIRGVVEPAPVEHPQKHRWQLAYRTGAAARTSPTQKKLTRQCALSRQSPTQMAGRVHSFVPCVREVIATYTRLK